MVSDVFQRYGNISARRHTLLKAYKMSALGSNFFSNFVPVLLLIFNDPCLRK
jgi:hypothetical protein